MSWRDAREATEAGERRQAFLHLGLDCREAVWRRALPDFEALALKTRRRRSPQRPLRGSGVERFTGARVVVLVAEVGETYLSWFGEVRRKVIRADIR